MGLIQKSFNVMIGETFFLIVIVNIDGIRDDMQLSKNSDNTITYTEYDDAEHDVVEVVKLGG